MAQNGYKIVHKFLFHTFGGTLCTPLGIQRREEDGNHWSVTPLGTQLRSFLALSIVQKALKRALKGVLDGHFLEI